MYLYVYMRICIYIYIYLYVYIYKVRLPQFKKTFIHPIHLQSAAKTTLRQGTWRISSNPPTSTAYCLYCTSLPLGRGRQGPPRRLAWLAWPWRRFTTSWKMSQQSRWVTMQMYLSKKYVCSSDMCFRIWLTDHEVGNNYGNSKVYNMDFEQYFVHLCWFDIYNDRQHIKQIW